MPLFSVDIVNTSLCSAVSPPCFLYSTQFFKRCFKAASYMLVSLNLTLFSSFFIDSCMYNVMRKFVRSSEPNEMFVADCEFCSPSIFLAFFYFLKSFCCFVSYGIAALTSLLSILLYEACMEDRIDEYVVVSAFWLHVPPAEIRAC